MRAACGIFLFVVLVFPCAIGGLCMLAANTWLFDREFYLDILDNPTLYEAVLFELPENLEVDIYERTDFSVAQREQANQALAMAFGEIVTPDYLQEETLRLVNEVFTMIETETYNVDIAINLQPVREAILGSEGEDFARTLAANLPACEPGQEPRNPDDPLIGCLSSNMSQEEAIESITGSLPAFVEDIPQRLIFSEVDTSAVDAGPVVVRSGYTRAMFTVLFIAFLLWVGNGFIAARGQRQLFFWLGGMLIVPAFLIFMLGVTMQNQWISGLENSLSEGTLTINNEPASQEYRDAMTDVMTTGFDRASNGFILVGGSAIAIAGLLLLLGRYSPPRYDDFYDDDFDNDKRKHVVVG